MNSKRNYDGINKRVFDAPTSSNIADDCLNDFKISTACILWGIAECSVQWNSEIVCFLNERRAPMTRTIRECRVYQKETLVVWTFECRLSNLRQEPCHIKLKAYCHKELHHNHDSILAIKVTYSSCAGGKRAYNNVR